VDEELAEILADHLAASVGEMFGDRRDIDDECSGPKRVASVSETSPPKRIASCENRLVRLKQPQLLK
jgi:hypothetical protein